MTWFDPSPETGTPLFKCRLPFVALKKSALERNQRWMHQAGQTLSFAHAPHAKTALAPSLMRWLTAQGSWGCSVATVSQFEVAAQAGIRRILFANEIADANTARDLVKAMCAFDDLEGYVFADSPYGVHLLREIWREGDSSRALSVLIEVGIPNSRAGCRTVEDAAVVAQEVSRSAPFLQLSGVAGYEGAVEAATVGDREQLASQLVASIGEVAQAFDIKGMFEDRPAILSAGGTVFMDIAAKGLRKVSMMIPPLVLVRAANYLFSDAGFYGDALARMQLRTPELHARGPAPTPVIEAWGVVLSRPENGVAIVGIGKREISTDYGLPMPVRRLARGEKAAVLIEPSSNIRVARVNDHHLKLTMAERAPVEVGDFVGLSIVHACTTLDKWSRVWVIDDHDVICGRLATSFHHPA